ncbi:MAG: ABC transporter permease [Cyclobacteriaceae bacterium]
MDQPPKWASKFLEWYCHPDLLEDLQGDLYEIFQKMAADGNPVKAKTHYVWLVFRSFRFSALKKNKKFKKSVFAMTRNNFKIAFRVLWRDKFNSSINLLGLTIGIACFLLLGLYVKQELSYDQFHSKKDRIYRTWLKEDYGEGRIFYNSTTPLRFEEMFESNFPEVEKAVQYIEQNRLVGRGENRINEKVAMISPDFFDVFDFEVLDGNELTPLPGRENLIISQAFAQKYFGDRDPIGKPLAIQIGEDVRDFTVSAVFVDIPRESSIQFDLAISTENGRDIYGDRLYTAWFSVVPETYVLFKEYANVAAVNEKMEDVVLGLMGDVGYGDDPMQKGQYNIGFQELTDIHLNPAIPLGFAPVNNPQYVFILGVIGILVLIIACINYTTLSAGQSLKRSKEVGMRKVLGAVKGTLIYQYLSESLLLALLAMLIGTVITVLLIPTFNLLTGTEIFFQFELWHVLVYLAIGLAIGLLAGAYPALVISGFKTINILRGSNQSSGKLAARKGLVIFQFLITVFLISTTLIMKQQVEFLQNKDLGYDYKAVISTRLSADPSLQRISERITSGFENGELLKAKLKKYPEITKIAMGSHMFGTSGWINMAFNDDRGDFRRFRMLVVDAAYMDAFGIKMKEGRSFEPDNGLDQRQSVIMNETAVRYFDLENPIGSKLPSVDFGEHQIIGVTEDFHFSSLHSEVEPLVIVQNPVPIFQGISDADGGDSLIPKLVFTYTGSNLLEATEILKKEWEATFPSESWNYDFIDERIKDQYENEARTNKLISVATFLSIVIASLGLLGLTMLVVNSKVKEIGIRKVMGASASSIFKLLARGFSIQLLIAIVLSIPVTIWLMNKWLANFAYRVDIGVGLFIVSALFSMIIAFVVISYHTVRATRVNPVESLRAD